jgi:hypothetical protein
LLHDRFSEELSLSAVAAAVGVHPVHLPASFARSTVARWGITSAGCGSTLPAGSSRIPKHLWPRLRYCPATRTRAISRTLSAGRCG